MAKIKAFKCIRPNENVVSKVAALPYDVYNTKEARVVVEDNPLSFLKIDRAETMFPEGIDIYSEQVYIKARDTLNEQLEKGVFVQDEKECIFLYELTMDGRSQTGIVSCSSVDDYLNNVIKKHENTRAEKEADRIHHVDTCSAQTGPIFLAYRDNKNVDAIVDDVKKTKPLYDFISEDGVGHRVWKIDNQDTIRMIVSEFDKINEIYIADGHHRAASAVKVSLKRREANKTENAADKGCANKTGNAADKVCANKTENAADKGCANKTENALEGGNANTQDDLCGSEHDYFLSVMFPDNQLKIMDYNRVVKDLNSNSEEEFFEKIKKAGFVVNPKEEKFSPNKKGTFGMFLNGKWFELVAEERILDKDPVEGLDVSILQNNLLGPILGIKDPRTDDRIDFVGGIRGLKELEKRCNEDMKVAFSMYPTSMAELFAVADNNRLMPPKSTWFEPKLRSGIFIHRI